MKGQKRFKMNANLIILAGGASSRMNASLNPLGTNEQQRTSKALIGIDSKGRPILDYLLLNAKQAGYTNIYLVIGEHAKAFKTYYGDKTLNNEFNGMHISYAIQYIPKNRIKPFGTADALFQALEQHPHLKNETFTVCNSDNLYSIEAFKALIECENSNAFIAYDREGLNFTMDRIARFALVLLDNENYLADIVEKPSVEDTGLYMDNEGKLRVSMNIFKLFGKDIYNHLKNCPVNPERDEKELPTAVLNLCKVKPKSVKGLLFNEHVPDLTSKEDILILKKYIEEHYKK